MMEEISISMAYDAHLFNQLSDEDFLAKLVEISKPKPVVSRTCFGECKIILSTGRKTYGLIL